MGDMELLNNLEKTLLLSLFYNITFNVLFFYSSFYEISFIFVPVNWFAAPMFY